jgi:hypothetical protein
VALGVGVLVLGSGGAAARAATWTIQTTPNAPNMPNSTLSSVSCPGSASCVAVGSSSNKVFTTHALAERWDGSAWTLIPPTVQSGWGASELTDVSCSSSHACTAVGSFTSAGKERTLAERWNGAHWSVEPTPTVSPTLRVHELGGVSCTASKLCFAVGDIGRDEREAPFRPAHYVGVVERWNGLHWTVQYTSPASSSTADHLADISCASSTACLTVGSRSSNAVEGTPLAVRWNGRHWKLLHPPDQGELAYLAAVSCSGPAVCMSVGSWFVSRDQNAFAEPWDGRHFTALEPPRPATAGAGGLAGVSCRSASDCVAVGGAGPADPSGGLAEGWDGMSWTIQVVPSADADVMRGVSCRPTFCIGVGSHAFNFARAGTLAERYG